MEVTPCDELAGDFLNYFVLDDRHLAMFVVDVSGHGTPSSLLAVAVGRLLTPNASATSLLVRIDPFTGRPRSPRRQWSWTSSIAGFKCRCKESCTSR